ncbi:GMC oxidoreductase [Podospora australis]|uniref:GMC oxidoreductase n=1 Tax=Podospora australis TaxID=1536484 RepID=A0AAN6WNV7_9PEZI|nr:GMC oxidoreductase [Podospora australis]
MLPKLTQLLPLGILGSALPSALATRGCRGNNTYDYIVVGSGPGGAPVASQLSRKGYSVLLLEAGDDQHTNFNVSVAPALADVAAEDETLRWDFFVRYHSDDQIQNSNLHLTWETLDGGHYVGQSPPAGAKPLGILYPRSGTLGGCSAHNAGAAMAPQNSFWDNIATITGDRSWSHESMRKYFVQFENNTHLPPGTPGHGFDGWLQTSTPDLNRIYPNTSAALPILRQLATSLGHDPATLFQRMRADVNSLDPQHDQQTGLFNLPFHHTPLGHRTNANLFLDATLAERKADGSPVNPLTIQLESFVTKILFDTTGSRGAGRTLPRAAGVEYLRGKSLYRADPRAPRSNTPLPARHFAFARKEVIISAGVFNTPQLLKLSGIGPASELRSHGIPLVADLPGVGAHLQDDYEISLAVTGSVSFLPPPLPNGVECTLGSGEDPCIALWENGTGPYTIPGPSHSSHLRTSVAENGERDIVLFNPPDVFRGFFPGYSRPQGDPNSTYSFALVHAQGRNHRGGTVLLKSADPRDVPEINFQFFEEGAQEDLQALYEGIEFSRGVLSQVPAPTGPFREFQPCPKGSELGACGERATKDFVRRQVYSHHASSTAAIGADGDRMAVLDGRFRVRKVRGLRVVDGSALPKVPSPFPIIGQYMASFRAADMILEDAKLVI